MKFPIPDQDEVQGFYIVDNDPFQPINILLTADFSFSR